MAYFNDSDGLRSAFNTPSEFNSRQFLWPQAISTPEEIHRDTAPTFTGGWDTVVQPGSSATPSTSLFGATTYELGSFTPGSNPDQLRGSYWSTTSQTSQDRPQTLSWEASLGSNQGWETRVPTPVNLRHRSASLGASARLKYSPIPNKPDRLLELTSAPRANRLFFHGYCVECTHRSTEAGPLGQAPPPSSYGTWRLTQPPGRSSETANAKQTINTEEEAPAPRARRGGGEGVERPYRKRNQDDIFRLRTWVRDFRGGRELPNHEGALTIAANIIPIIRQPQYDNGPLFRGRGLRASVGSKEADKKFEKRRRIREVYQELSRYYPLREGRSEWTTTELMVRVLEDLETLNGILEKN